MKVGLVWFGQDLRVSDHELLTSAAREMDFLICLYCHEPRVHRPSRYGTSGLSSQRNAFLTAALNDVSHQLALLGQRLYYSEKEAFTAITCILDATAVTHLYRNHHPGYDETVTLERIAKAYPEIRVRQAYDLSLFDPTTLPFAVASLPSSFSKFRRYVDSLDVAAPLAALTGLPVPVQFNASWVSVWQERAVPQTTEFSGGEAAAQQQLTRYFAGHFPSTYKAVRNELEGWNNSTKFSPWLAHGNLSPRQIKASVTAYERDQGANESTYWIYFEVLWREYFHWYATRYGRQLFTAKGVTGTHVQGSFYPERFRKWCQGNTPYPLVNACMKQLNATGYMSNRGRQIVASCLIYELGLNWRYGAAYFESQLLDYDVGSNWGNWQYIAGVGADPRGGRHFNLAKQTQQYDPMGRFIREWQGDQFDEQLDSVDAADWPIYPESTPLDAPSHVGARSR